MEACMDKLNVINCGRYHTIINLNGEYENHCHVKTKNTAELLIKLIRRKKVPKSNYLRQSAMRISLDEKYLNSINNKMDKDKQKQKYYNSQKGVR